MEYVTLTPRYAVTAKISENAPANLYRDANGAVIAATYHDMAAAFAMKLARQFPTTEYRVYDLTSDEGTGVTYKGTGHIVHWRLDRMTQALVDEFGWGYDLSDTTLAAIEDVIAAVLMEDELYIGDSMGAYERAAEIATRYDGNRLPLAARVNPS